MRSFHLDTDSVADFLDSWPALILGVVLAGLSFVLGVTQLWSRVVAILFVAVYGVFLLRGVIAQRLRAQYPGARWIWLLSVAFTSSTIGVATRMAVPTMRVPSFDLAWLGVTFLSVLTFVLANRNDEHVVR